MDYHILPSIIALIDSLSIDDIITLSNVNEQFRDRFRSEEVNRYFANHYNLPYNLSLEEIKTYQNLSLFDKLEIAYKLNDYRMIKILIEQSDLDEILELFVKYGDIDMVNKVIENSDSKEDLIYKISTYAIKYNKIDILKLMLDITTNLDIGNLSLALEGDNMDIIRLLLNFGDYYDHEYVTLIMLEKRNMGDIDTEKVKSFLQLMIDEYHIINHNDIAIQLVGDYGDDSEEIVKFLIERGANNYDQIARYAYKNKYNKILELMIEMGARDYQYKDNRIPQLVDNRYDEY